MIQVADSIPLDGLVRVDRLQLAAWLRLNQQKLVARELLPTGKIAYYFEPSSVSTELIQTWSSRTPQTEQLSAYARIVSREIREAVKWRRIHSATAPVVED
jgi:hypothetical protein